MALFNDGPASGIADLQGHDSQLLDVAHVEGIDVTRKLALAQEELALELTTLLARLNQSTDFGVTAGGAGLAQVVVTPPLKLWHTFRTLELVYRDAYHSQLNDRYAGKRDEYHELAKWAYEKLIQSGIGVAQDPIPQAEAPTLAPAAGTLPDGKYYAAAAWTNRTGEEGAASVAAAITTTASTFTARPSIAPANAQGWNVYVGVSPTSLVLQNASPMGVGQIWTQTSGLVTTGKLAPPGQAANYMRQAPRILQRG
jgi:hypothetical protein